MDGEGAGSDGGRSILLQQSLLMSRTKQEFSANMKLLQQLQKGVLEQGALDLRSQARSGGMTAKALGDSSNLVYKSLEPCRIMDTRNASGGSGVQGPIVGNTLYHIPGFVTAGGNWVVYGQTGTPSDCGLTNPPGTNIFAVAIVITILNPNFDAYLGVGDNNSLTGTLNNVALNFTHGQGLSTMYIVPQRLTSNIYFAMPVGLSAQIIFDVVGYFAISDATALSCNTLSTPLINIPAYGAFQAFAPACPAGSWLVSTYCYADSYSMVLSTTNFGCSYLNEGPSSHNISASSICCQVAGK